MSTKIYFAYRMPTKVFNTFLASFRNVVFAAAKEHVRKMTTSITEQELKAFFKERKGAYGRVSFKKYMEEHESNLRVKLVLQKIKDESKSRLRSLDCIDCSLNVWMHAGRMYVILYGESWLWRHFKPPEKVEDYCYWNNTDEPDGVTRRQWKARGDTWDKVCLDDDWNATRMVHDIIHASQEIGLTEVAARIVGKDNAHAASWLD